MTPPFPHEANNQQRIDGSGKVYESRFIVLNAVTGAPMVIAVPEGEPSPALLSLEAWREMERPDVQTEATSAS